MTYPIKKNSESKGRGEDYLYLLLHIHKCAGYGMSSHMLKSFTERDILGLYRSMGDGLEHRGFITAYVKGMSKQRKRSLRIVMGHGVFVDIQRYFARPVRNIVFLRNPLERSRSHYGYFLYNTVSGFATRPGILDRKGQPVGFIPWLKKTVGMHDYMTRFLYERLTGKKVQGEVTDRIFREVVKGLEKFYMVGLVERKTDHYYLYSTLGLPLLASHENVTPKVYRPDNVPDRYIAPYVRFDQKLYDHFQHHPVRPYGLIQGATLMLSSAFEYLWEIVQ